MTKERRAEDSRIVPVEVSELGRAIVRLEEAMLRGEVAVVAEWMEMWPRWPEQMAAAHSRRIEKAEDLGIRTIHAAIVLLADDLNAGLVPERLAASATTRLVTASSGAPEERWLCAALPAQLRLSPRGLQRHFVDLLSDKVVPVQVVAAAALSGYLTAPRPGDGSVSSGGRQVSLLDVTERLRYGVRQCNPMTAAIAARSLVRLRARDSDADYVREAMLERLQANLDVPETYAVIEALQEAGRPAPDAVKEALFAIASDEARDPIVRRVAARAFAGIADANDDVELFLGLLSLDCDAVRGGLIASLTEESEFEQAALRVITGYLESDDAVLREKVARMLATWPAGARQVLPRLMERIGKESDFYALDAIADALASVGPEIADRLTAILESRNVLVITAISLVLRRLGAAGARALMRALDQQQDLMHRSMMFVVLRDLGPAAREIVPDLARLLLATEDEDYAYVIVQSILASGAPSAALPALIETVLARRGVIAELASTAIRGIGPNAVPQVEAALQVARGAARELLERSLMWVPVDARAFERLQSLSPDRLIVFYHATGVWIEHGRMTLSSVARMLQGNSQLPDSIKRSESTLQRTVAEVAAAFGRKQLLRGGARSPSEITNHGRSVRCQIRRYARQIGIDLYDNKD